MSARLGRRASRACAGCLALAVAGCAGSSSTASTSGSGPGGQPGPPSGTSAPPRDTFTGVVLSATGAYSGSHGAVRIYLHPHGSGQRRAARVVFTGRCSGASGRCLRLSGTVGGTLASLARGLPDTGHVYGLSGAGRVSPLGTVRLSGEVAGTGFISRGQLLIRLTLTGSSGAVRIVAHSGVVKGFTSP